jgi:hypothetical protein
MLAMSLVLLSCVNEAGTDMVKEPAIIFSASEPMTRAFIEDINRSGNELVVYDYMTGIEGTLTVDPDDRWYIDHARIHCTVDGQQVWDYVSGDEYFWLYGSNHSCFGWLFSGPSGNNTITFFGEHPHFEKDSFRLSLPVYKFTHASPIYDFLYSDVTKRTYTQQNPDSSPIPLKMNHLFSAFRFTVRSVRQAPVTIHSAVLKVVTRKKATIDFEGPVDTVTGGKPEVIYTEAQSDTLQLKDINHELTGGSAAINLFDRNDVEAFRMIWPQDETEFAEAVLEIGFSETVEGQVRQQTKLFRLNSSQQKEWLAGNRYSYEIVFTDKEITLTCEVLPWNKKEIVLDFTEVVVVSDKIQWHDNTISHLDEHTGEVLLFNNTTAAECYFKIDAPQGARWIASLVPVSGAGAAAFEFVDPNTGVALDEANPPSGSVGEIGKIKVRVKDPSKPTDTNKARLRIVVSTANVQDPQVIVVENLCPGHDYNEYTLVQNMIY